MKYILRDYQKECSDSAIRFFHGDSKSNGIIVLPTGSGKSLCIADIAYRLNDNVLVFQPSKEILEQNFSKLRSYGVEDCSIYSASFNKKEISRITFATIGSVTSHMEDFNIFKFIIVDECHLINSKGGMYKRFFECTKRKILGLTATPYRLDSSFVSIDSNGKYDKHGVPQYHSILKFLTRTRPRIFSNVIYHIDIDRLLSLGYLAKIEYFNLNVIDTKRVKKNSTGRDYDNISLSKEFERINLQSYLVTIINRLKHPKNGQKRRGILVFTKFLSESEYLCSHVEGCMMISGDTPKAEREKILSDFRNGDIEVLTNVGVLVTGYDYPELDTVVVARPTMSLSVWYQICGRVIRPHPEKESSWVVDLCGNIGRFGKVENLRMVEKRRGEYTVEGEVGGIRKQLTNVYF